VQPTFTRWNPSCVLLCFLAANSWHVPRYVGFSCCQHSTWLSDFQSARIFQFHVPNPLRFSEHSALLDCQVWHRPVPCRLIVHQCIVLVTSVAYVKTCFHVCTAGAPYQGYHSPTSTKVKLSLRLTKHHALKTYGTGEVQHHAFFTSELDGG
jgi:hypothetical protein